MSDQADVPDGAVELSTKGVEFEGPYGWVSWLVSRKLHDVLPVGERDELCAMAAQGKAEPFFDGLLVRLLNHAGLDPALVATFDPSWSLETVTVNCHVVGTVNWNIGQGLWDTLAGLAAEQRTTLLEMAQMIIHEFFENSIGAPLFRYSIRKLRG
jgi:hypothetical protein